MQAQKAVRSKGAKKYERNEQMYVWMHVCMYVQMCVCMDACMYVYIDAWMYACI